MSTTLNKNDSDDNKANTEVGYSCVIGYVGTEVKLVVVVTVMMVIHLVTSCFTLFPCLRVAYFKYQLIYQLYGKVTPRFNSISQKKKTSKNIKHS